MHKAYVLIRIICHQLIHLFQLGKGRPNFYGFDAGDLGEELFHADKHPPAESIHVASEGLQTGKVTEKAHVGSLEAVLRDLSVS